MVCVSALGLIRVKIGRTSAAGEGMASICDPPYRAFFIMLAPMHNAVRAALSEIPAASAGMTVFWVGYG